jgi:hypothetical protein
LTLRLVLGIFEVVPGHSVSVIAVFPQVSSTLLAGVYPLAPSLSGGRYEGFVNREDKSFCSLMKFITWKAGGESVYAMRYMRDQLTRKRSGKCYNRTGCWDLALHR